MTSLSYTKVIFGFNCTNPMQKKILQSVQLKKLEKKIIALNTHFRSDLSVEALGVNETIIVKPHI